MQHRFIAIAGLASLLTLGTVARANSGTQLPLNAYQAGTETATLVPNGGFESATGGDADAPWTETLAGMSVGAHIGGNSSAPILGSLAASASAVDLTQYRQSISTSQMDPLVDNVLSAYIWNFGNAGPGGFDPGDMAVVELRNGSAFVNILLEPVALDSGLASDGYFVYTTIPAGTFPAGADLDVRMDLDSAGPWPTIVAQFDNIAITPASVFQPVAPIPEPASLALLAIAGLGAMRRRRA